MTPDDIATLRRLWLEGLASGPAGELELVALRREARERLARGRDAARNPGRSSGSSQETPREA